MPFKPLIKAAFFTFCLLSTSLQAGTKGKIEIAPSYVHIDLIESNDTIKRIDMAAIRVEGAWCFGKGYYLKPFGMYGKQGDSELTTAGISIGRCIPLGKAFLLSPSVGVNYTKLNTTINLTFPEIGDFKFQESFTGWAPFVALELVYNICPNLRASTSVQYAWSRSTTDIKDVLRAKSDSEGFAYAAMLEYDFSACWSVNAAVAYNESYSKEKNGIRGRGGKIGLVRWF
jgi:hypothetical protein